MPCSSDSNAEETLSQEYPPLKGNEFLSFAKDRHTDTPAPTDSTSSHADSLQQQTSVFDQIEEDQANLLSKVEGVLGRGENEHDFSWLFLR